MRVYSNVKTIMATKAGTPVLRITSWIAELWTIVEIGGENDKGLSRWIWRIWLGSYWIWKTKDKRRVICSGRVGEQQRECRKRRIQPEGRTQERGNTTFLASRIEAQPTTTEDLFLQHSLVGRPVGGELKW
jgi:hypothetical protein